MFLKTKDATNETLNFIKKELHFVVTLSRRTYFWDTAVPCGFEKSHNVVQLNPNEDKNYLLTPYSSLTSHLKKSLNPRAYAQPLVTQKKVYNE